MGVYSYLLLTSVAFAFVSLLILGILPNNSLYHEPTGESKSPTKFFPPPWCSDPSPDNCSFYSSCLEPLYHCGPTGYPLGYGQKFCQDFSTERHKLGPQGQKWMIDTMHCLQFSLVPDIYQSETCSELQSHAFGTHARCYLQSGLCTLSLEDWIAIVEIVHIGTLFQSWDAFVESAKAGIGCSEFFAFAVFGLHR